MPPVSIKSRSQRTQRTTAERRGPAVRRSPWRWGQLLSGATVLAVLAWRLGGGPFLAGLRDVTVPALFMALAVNAVTTLACAWRWRAISRALGLDLRLRSAIAAYYRSQFLNGALPGGVLGDVHRGVRHGRQGDDVARGLRSVAWDRLAGQLVQVLLTVIVLLTVASPVRRALPAVVIGLGALVLLAAIVFGLAAVSRSPWVSRLKEVLRADVQLALLACRSWPTIALSSTIVVAGHVLVFVLAARTAGVSASIASTASLLPIALLVLLAMAVPATIGGWGPREGVAAWTFAAAGLGPAHGVAVATVYGVLSLAATLPGAVVLAYGSLRRPVRESATTAAPPLMAVPAATALLCPTALPSPTALPAAPLAPTRELAFGGRRG
ncbi:MAG: flippase-like domain-containing protein [Actinobacteria bacterium]|nr:flippase-like domain-containing protein [Actinomycetota bacterium]